MPSKPYTYADGSPWSARTFAFLDPVIGNGVKVSCSDTPATKTGDGVHGWTRLPWDAVATPPPPATGGGVSPTDLATALAVKADAAALAGKVDVAGAPAALDTADELAAALGDDPAFAATMLSQLAGKAPLFPAANVRTAVSGALTLPAPPVFDHDISPSGTLALTLPSGFGGAAWVTVLIRQPAGGGQSVTFANVAGWVGGVQPQIDKGANALTPFTFYTSNGGSTWIGSGIGVNLAALLTAKGDLLVATGAGAATRLPAGSTAGVLQTDGQGNWTVAPAAAPASTGGAGELVAVEYWPNGAQTDVTTTSATPVDVAASGLAAATPWANVTATSFDLTATFPASGALTVRMSAYMKTGTANNPARLALYDVGAAGPVANSQQNMVNTTNQARVSYEKRITGTPGATITLRPQWLVNSGAVTGTLSVGGANGPFRFQINAASS